MSKHKQYDVATSTLLSTGLEGKRVGYKKTKLGWIPEDWNVKSLDQLGEFSKGKGITKKDILEDEVGGLPCVRYAEIYTIYHYNTTVLKSKINQESAANSNPINCGDILFAGSGETLEDIGKSIAYLNKETAYAGGDICILKHHNQDPQFLGYLFNNDVVRSQLYKIGQGHSVVHIYSSGLKKVSVPIPPLPEQQKIASILNTWDKAIAAQEKLIAQKQALKNGLMQQLLTGKKRFAGFVEEWEEKSLNDIVKYLGGEAFKSTNQVENGVRWLKIANVGIGVVKWGDSTTFLPTSFIDENPKYVLKAGDAVMALTRPILNDKLKIAVFNKEDGIALLNQRVAKLISKNKNDLKFIYYIHQTPYFIYTMNAMMAGTDPPNISIKDLAKKKVFIPGYEEQKKIVSVIESFDNEIDNLINKGKHLKKQKQGLMQQLLTGEKRVKG
ncbi:type I restriction-modification system, specificity subunit S HsdS [Psychroflexus torquis ATCC 700755]|uniref:Type I restriction-modification system, specificity subunit S HsdS n=1 Tax=Psychroflexus torquis (strain ATCC 700755 / CIP 106069 / ACAM 623) TaxID=313595 RepID=K4I9F2_PSYTT|nr:restriction endonuclease subunit S [Psychroflexus torquis]AFU67267.1 type I restriction-modification system, specificity subunit S HsdS [Psychroflexus torquis ATCC 700755]